ncbi:anti-sigma factor family protein [Vallitalea sp.]|jgi:hypothetical protein|uniref:anti-sigma factor family protein n=1 Tax=Vallitalea sp. TaxID=1882829 RepID=UPI0025E84C0B|nr:zf-HC2 domain-containing protein [Vallitalea sp.]MCT4688418.1 zf-HC2 domain-containing protein [Vallitalea sp.]
MDCSKVQEMMSLYIDNQLSKEERKLFEEHIVSCEQCKEELHFLQTMIDNVNDINEEKELPTDFHKNLMVKIDSTNSTEIQTENRIYRLNRFAKYYTAVAAVFVIVLVFGFIGKTNINRITDDKLQYNVNTESIKEDSIDKDMIDEATKESAPRAAIRSKSFNNDPVDNNENKSDETITTEGDLGTFEFQVAEDGDTNNPVLYEETKNDVQVLTKDDNAGLKDEEFNYMDKDNKALYKNNGIENVELSESKSNYEWIVIIGIIIILIIPLLYIKIQKNKLNR